MPVKTGEPTPLALSTRVLIFFASNPDIELTSNEMRVKFEIGRKTAIPYYLEGRIKEGTITKIGEGRATRYRAGPALLKELGDEE